MTSLLYGSNIQTVKFHLSGDQEAEKDAVVKIKYQDLYRNGKPFVSGLYDLSLGTIDMAYKCGTCRNDKRDCLGHSGVMDLNYPVINSLAIKDLQRWIKVICFNCGKPVLPKKDYAHFGRAKRLDKAATIARGSSIRNCTHCGKQYPIIKKNANEPLLYYAEYYDEKRLIGTEFLYPHILAGILNKISNETCIELGKDPKSHPRNFILHKIKVPPTAIRPDIKKAGGGRSTNDDLTSMLQIIIRKNTACPTVIPEKIEPKFEKTIYELNNAYKDFIVSNNTDSPFSSVAKRFRGKQGRFRKNGLGKRVFNMARSTITGNPTIKVNEIVIPLSFAQTIQISEVVQEYNKDLLMIYVNNGRTSYPGATFVKKANGRSIKIEKVREQGIEIGDIVYRDIINGDYVNFNRQPSLMPSNITTMKVIVCEDPANKTIQMNVTVAPYFGADFDGDQMNLIVPTSAAPINEISILSTADKWFMTHASAPLTGQVDDSIIGMYQFTQSDVMLDPYHTMLLFQNITNLPNILQIKGSADSLHLTGREIVSKILEQMPIDFSIVPESFKEVLAPWIRYNVNDIKVEINQGKVVKGVLDKKSIGKGGKLYQIIANEHGCKKALESIFNLQQISTKYLMQYGYTIGTNDLIIDKRAAKTISEIESDIVNKSKLITDKLNNGELIPPIGKTLEEFYEEQQINILTIYDDFIDPIMSLIDVKSNNLFKLVVSGSKGKLEQIFNIMSVIGQKLINGERIRQQFGYRRTLVYFKRFDTTPGSRGFIYNSYLGGMTSEEYIFNAMAARFDLISKALSTSVTGEQNRKSVKNLESIVVNNLRWAVKGATIIQFGYGENYLDPRRIEKVKIPTVLLSTKEFEEKYRVVTTADMDKSLQSTFDAEFASLQADREKYRKLYLHIESVGGSGAELFSAERKLAFNPERIINTTIKQFSGVMANATPLKMAEVAECVKIVNEFITALPYILINEIQERSRKQIPEMIQAAVWLHGMAVRAYLCSAVVISARLGPKFVKIILDKIRLKYSQALIDPGTAVGILAAQSFSEPLTQYMLDAPGSKGSGRTQKSGMTKTKEVLGARPVDKLKSPTMHIYVESSHIRNRAKVQEIANNIEVMQLKQFVSLWQIYFEKFGAPVHSQTKHEVAMFTEFAKYNPLLKPPSDLVKWCIRLVLNKTNLIFKNMSLELIINKIRENFPDVYVVYTPENAKINVLRVYCRSIMFKSAIDLATLENVKENLLNMIIRGVNNIINTRVTKIIRTGIDEAGKIAINDNYVITTDGTNLADILKFKGLDHKKCRTDAIKEVNKMYGIEAARTLIISELRAIVDSADYSCYITYADMMCVTGEVTSIARGGLALRETQNILLRIASGQPIQTLEESALNSAVDNITGVSSHFLIGSVPRIGTLHNRVIVNRKFIESRSKELKEELKEELENL